MIQAVLHGGETVETDLSVFLNHEAASYDTYIGVALLERVPISAEALAHKMLVGRLYNAGAKLCDLVAAFKHDHRTIKNWGKALRSGNLELMAVAFAGRSGGKKTSPELIRFIQQQYRNRASLGRAYRHRIIEMVEEVFWVRISPSLVSAIFRTVEEEGRPEETGPEKTQLSASDGCSPREMNVAGGRTVEQSPIFPFFGWPHRGGGVLLRHAGLVLFWLWLRCYRPIERQLICQLLLGAVNVEQSKSICHVSLGYFTEGVLKGLREQRTALDQEASLENVISLYQQNAALLSDGPGRGDLYYFDPHTKEYTGQLKILKGWCGRRHSITKVINLDCFHTRSGRPCFVQHYSPYYDMRERFFMSLALFDRLFDKQHRQGRTFVIDRAIYGLDALGRFEDDYVITWEKGFDGTGWDSEKSSHSFTRQRCRNHANDQKSYTFEYQSAPWKRNSSFQRILVKATRKNGSQILVSILCNHPTMDLQDVVWAIFSRWLQENDFKYLDVHFGINQLDTRASSDFSSRKDAYEDRMIDSPDYKKLKTELVNLDQKLANRLLKQRRANQKQDQLNIQIQQLTAQIETAKTSQKKLKERKLELAAAKRKRTNTQKRISQLQTEIIQLEQESERLAQLLNESIQKESRLQQLIDGTFQLLDLRRKAYMDALRINAANMFRNLHHDYRHICNNYRDDHHRLRMLTRCSGFLSQDGNQWHLQLWLPGSLQNHIIKALEEFVIRTMDEFEQYHPTPLRVSLLTGPITNLNPA